MLDLVSEEDNVSRLAGMSFEHLLALLDDQSPAALQDLYAAASDRYMILAGKGRRTPDEDMDLDRLDSSLRLMLGAHGLMVFVAHLLQVFSGARQGTNAFRGAGGPGADLAAASLALGTAAATSREHFQRTPLPIDGERLAHLAEHAAQAAEALDDMGAGGRGPGWPGARRRAARRGTTRLLGQLRSSHAGAAAWLAAGALLGPAAMRPALRAERLEGCYRTAGLLACTVIEQETGHAFRESSDLIREGLE